MTPAIQTERLRLYAPYHRMFDIERQVGWLNDKHVVKYSEQRHRQHTLDSQWKYVGSFDHVSHHIWEISRKNGCYDYPMGTITAYRDLQNKTADIGIMIGNRDVWGSGYGSEAWEAVMEFLYKDGVQKIEAGTVEANKGMVAIMERSGMEREGIRRNHFIIDGWPHSVVLMGRSK